METKPSKKSSGAGGIAGAVGSAVEGVVGTEGEVLEDINPFAKGTQAVQKATGGNPRAAAQGTGKLAGEGAQAAASPLTGWAEGAAQLIKTYGLRLGEILAGGALILFGLVTLARGGQAPPVPGVTG